MTPAHHYPDFRFKTYAPLAFRYFRDLFGIKPDDYLVRNIICQGVIFFSLSPTVRVSRSADIEAGQQAVGVQAKTDSFNEACGQSTSSQSAKQM